jgi:hypothetical protein
LETIFPHEFAPQSALKGQKQKSPSEERATIVKTQNAFIKGVKMKNWYTFEEISEELGIPLKSIYMYHRRGDGPNAHQFGKHLRVHHTELIKWQNRKFARK